MGQRDDCREELQSLEQTIDQFRVGVDDPNDIRLEAQSLGFRYYTIVTLAKKIDAGLDVIVRDLLETARKMILEQDQDLAQLIQDEIDALRKLPAEILGDIDVDDLDE